MFISGCFINNWANSQKVFSQRTSDILELVCLQFLKYWNYFANYTVGIQEFAKIGKFACSSSAYFRLTISQERYVEWKQVLAGLLGTQTLT